MKRTLRAALGFKLATGLELATGLKLAIGLTLTACVVLNGCAVMGRQQKENPIDATKVVQVKKGMHKSEVAQLLGAPTNQIFNNKELDILSTYAYVYEHVVTKYTGIFFFVLNFGNSDEKVDRVIVFFDNEGKVTSVGASLFADDASFGFPFGQ